MKPVVQEDPTGCGFASVAMLAGVGYAQVKREATWLGIEVTDSGLWHETDYVRQLASRFGVRLAPEEKAFGDWGDLPDRALLAIKWHLEKDGPAWHWVVFVRDGAEAYVLDPKRSLRTNRRTDFGRIKPKWFIAVQ